MHKIQEMKQKVFNPVAVQLEERDKLDHFVNNIYGSLQQNSFISAHNLHAFCGGDPRSQLNNQNQVVAQNFGVIEKNLQQEQNILAQINSDIANNKNILQNLKSRISSVNSNLNETNSKTREMQQKIEEANRQKELKYQEYKSLHKSLMDLISNMNPKQVSFVLQKSIEQQDVGTISSLINSVITNNFDPNFQNANQNTLLHTIVKYSIVTYFGCHIILQHAIRKSPNINLVDKDGNSALHICIQNNDLDTLKKLMITGLNINLANKDGNTVLHYAASTNNLPIVKYLLEECPYKNAININLKNNLNKSCADLASGAVKTYLTPLITMSVKEIEYDNPILNHPEIIKNAVEKCGGSIISKLIDLGKQFADNEEHKELLETVCQSDNSLENLLNLLNLIGLDLQQESI